MFLQMLILAHIFRTSKLTYQPERHIDTCIDPGVVNCG